MGTGSAGAAAGAAEVPAGALDVTGSTGAEATATVGAVGATAGALDSSMTDGATAGADLGSTVADFATVAANYQNYMPFLFLPFIFFFKFM